MLKFNNEVADIFNKIDGLLNNINHIIERNSDFDSLVNERINRLYIERKIHFNQLNDWLESNEAKDFVKSNSQEWNDFILSMQAKDKIVLDKISDKLATLKQELANLNNNKSLFIYSK